MDHITTRIVMDTLIGLIQEAIMAACMKLTPPGGKGGHMLNDHKTPRRGHKLNDPPPTGGRGGHRLI